MAERRAAFEQDLAHQKVQLDQEWLKRRERQAKLREEETAMQRKRTRQEEEERAVKMVLTMSEQSRQVCGDICKPSGSGWHI